MQTFLPYPEFQSTVEVLDYRRLGKQRVEAAQIWNILTGRTTSSAWKNHPAVLMWKGCEDALALYADTCIEEWIRRGYRNNMPLMSSSQDPKMPRWLGDPGYHAAHRSNLLRKDFAYYSQFGWLEPDTLPYIWPGSGTR
jgi:hypothetical protein